MQKAWSTDKRNQPDGQNFKSYDSALHSCQVSNQMDNAFSVRVQKQNNCEQANGQTNRRNGLNIKSNLAMMAFYLHVKFGIDWRKEIWARVRKLHLERRIDRYRTHQSNRWFGYMQPAANEAKKYKTNPYPIPHPKK